ncbi:MAG: hypothetical protein ABI353_05070, partial [Isosphaeraceae bacterium]
QVKGSLTGAILKNVLIAGPHEKRPRFDPEAAAKVALEATRQTTKAPALKVKSPWEIDGRRWHTLDRVTRTGKPARWDGRLLERIVDRIDSLCGFPEPDWSHRAVVRIGGFEPDSAPFFEALTGQEWVVTLRFRVPRNTFRQAELGRQLALLPFHETSPPVHSDAERVVVENVRGIGQEVVITAHSADELDTDEFDAFLLSAVAAAQNLVDPNLTAFGDSWQEKLKDLKPRRKSS